MTNRRPADDAPLDGSHSSVWFIMLRLLLLLFEAVRIALSSLKTLRSLLRCYDVARGCDWLWQAIVLD
jgi:hypothetical protein